jgi:hypothetical protein
LLHVDCGSDTPGARTDRQLLGSLAARYDIMLTDETSGQMADNLRVIDGRLADDRNPGRSVPLAGHVGPIAVVQMVPGVDVKLRSESVPVAMAQNPQTSSILWAECAN